MRLGTRSAVIAMALVGGFAVAAPAQAQIGVTVFGAGEFDTNDVALVLGGVSLSRNGLGLSPVLAGQAYWLRYPVGNDDESLTSINPSAGLKYTFNGGSIEGLVGYAFTDRDSEVLPPAFVTDTEDGVTTTAHLEYWGTGRLGAQGIVNYNWGSETLWTRGRVTHRIASMGTDGHLRLGAEAAYLYNQNYDALQVGGVFGLVPGRHVQLVVRGGGKFDAVENGAYFGAEIVIMP